MSKNVTNRLLLKAIHDTYYSEFCSFDKNAPSRSSKIYVPIDCKTIAKSFNLDPDIVFGRLYYHLDKKHGYKKDDGSMVHLFSSKTGEDSHAVNFPLLSAVLAELEQSYYRFTIPIGLSILALFISIASYLSVN
ncbi:MAG: hypothetical protein KZQ83_12995 [gamma proteobacterium symbiont of Taylorina sp.]|nr:hypothetical protein [gamma proteobacterium symbiont of Taylorina sp.]